MVLFWSGLCSHCLRYDDYLNRFVERHPELGLVAVASRYGETADQIRTIAAERKLAFPIVHDPPGAVARQWYTQQTPRAFLIDRDRKLLYRGAIDNFKFPEDSDYQAYLDCCRAVRNGGFTSDAEETRTDLDAPLEAHAS